MLTARDVAMYFINKDSGHEMFGTNVITRNGRTFYEGNARLNKYLHLAQNLYIAKTGQKLFEDDLYAYDNGGVVPDVQENYVILLNKGYTANISDEIGAFLDKFFTAFSSADIDELIEASHEDAEWEAHSRYYAKPDQKMNSLSRVEEYREQYSDMLRVMERMPI